MAEENGSKREDNPEFKNFQRLLKQVVSVPKEELDKRKAEHERDKDRKRVG